MMEKYYTGMENKYGSQKRISSCIAGVRISIPREIIDSIVKKHKLYEAESISDVIHNYEMLLKKRFPPWKAMKWAVREIAPQVQYSNLEEYIKADDHRYSSNNGEKIPRINANVVTLDNIYIGNFSFFEGPKITIIRGESPEEIDMNMRESKDWLVTKSSYKSVEFDLTDHSKEVIRGALVYEGAVEDEDKKKSQLEMILRSENAETFDIIFKALPERYFNRKQKKEITREKLLMVSEIREKRGDRESEEAPDPGYRESPVISPVFSFS